MQNQQTGTSTEKVIIPLFDIVVYPGSRTKFQVDRTTGELLLEAMKDETDVHAIGLTVKSGTRPQDLTPESLYRVGNLFHLDYVSPADDGYVICARVAGRVRARAIHERDGRHYAEYSALPDIPDLDDDLKGRILGDIKLAIHEISSRFSGSDRFTEPIDRMDSVDQIMGFV